MVLKAKEKYLAMEQVRPTSPNECMTSSIAVAKSLSSGSYLTVVSLCSLVVGRHFRQLTVIWYMQDICPKISPSPMCTLLRVGVADLTSEKYV